jgi:hypothetical protein
VNRVLVFSDKVVLKPKFSSALVSGVAKQGIIVADRSTGNVSSFDMGITSASPYLNGFEKDGNKRYVGGMFTATLAGITRSNLARYTVSNSGVTLDSWDPTVDQGVFDLAVTPDRVFIAGIFTTVNGQPKPTMAALEKSSRDLHPGFTMPSMTGSIDGLAYNPFNNQIYIEGQFTAVSGQPRNGLAALSLNGNLNLTFNPLLQFDAFYLDSSMWPMGSFWQPSLSGMNFINGNMFANGFFNLVNGTLFKGTVVHLNADTGATGSLTDDLQNGNTGSIQSKVRTLNGGVLLPSGSYRSFYRTGFSFMSMSGTIAP